MVGAQVKCFICNQSTRAAIFLHAAMCLYICASCMNGVVEKKIKGLGGENVTAGAGERGVRGQVRETRHSHDLHGMLGQTPSRGIRGRVWSTALETRCAFSCVTLALNFVMPPTFLFC